MSTTCSTTHCLECKQIYNRNSKQKINYPSVTKHVVKLNIAAKQKADYINLTEFGGNPIWLHLHPPRMNANDANIVYSLSCFQIKLQHQWTHRDYATSRYSSLSTFIWKANKLWEIIINCYSHSYRIILQIKMFCSIRNTRVLVIFRYAHNLPQIWQSFDMWPSCTY